MASNGRLRAIGGGFEHEVDGDVRQRHREHDLPEQGTKVRSPACGGGANHDPHEAALSGKAEAGHDKVGPRGVMRGGPQAGGGIEEQQTFKHRDGERTRWSETLRSALASRRDRSATGPIGFTERHITAEGGYPSRAGEAAAALNNAPADPNGTDTGPRRRGALPPPVLKPAIASATR